MSIKPYPCCHFAHGAIDCAIALRDDGVRSGDIGNIHAIIDEVAAGFVCDPIEAKHAPSNAYGAKFSLPYLVACGLIDGRVDQVSFTDEQIRRDDLLSLARRTGYENAAKGTTGFPRYFPGHLRVTLVNGQVIDKRVAINRGNPDAPLSDGDVIRKFNRNVETIVSPERARAIAENVLSLETSSGFADLMTELSRVN